jgi:hypothetical protein
MRLRLNRLFRFMAIIPFSLLAEFAAILLLALLYGALFSPASRSSAPDGMDIEPLRQLLTDPQITLSGLEHERLAGVILAARVGLQDYGHIPAWNPFVSTGVPLFNNGFNYLFNPFHSLPILLLGGVQGSKLAIIIAVLLAGCNMWALARVVGLGAAARVFTAVLYMMSGGFAGKIYAGHFQLALSLAWPPLVLAALWWTLHSRRRLAPIAFALAFMLLFFAGNIYYVLHTLFCCAVITAAHLAEQRDGRWRWQLDRLWRVATAGALAFGLAAPLFFPIWETRDFVAHARQVIHPEGRLAGNYSLGQAFANLTYPWPDWVTFEASNSEIYVAVDYAYIGPTVFLLITAVAVAALLGWLSGARYRRLSLIALLLALLMMVWGSGQTPILEWLYSQIDLLSEFRFLGRALSIAALWWVILAGIAVDLLWRAARSRSPSVNNSERRRLTRMLAGATLVWLLWCGYSVAGAEMRAALTLNIPDLLLALDQHRFPTVDGAADGLWLFLLVALAFDTGLITLNRVWRRVRARSAQGVALWTRLVRVGLLVMMIGAAADVMRANSLLFDFQPAVPGYTPVYLAVRQADTNPFPTINEPFSSLAFGNYDYRVRSWGWDEGWLPESPDGPFLWVEGGLNNRPRWALISNNYGGDSLRLAQAFVEDGYVQRGCFKLADGLGVADPCDVNGAQINAVLYENPLALPYAFIASEQQLRSVPNELNASNVIAAHVLTHRLDALTLEAARPDDGQEHYLIVQETHFPGWRASVDGVPLEVVTMPLDYRVEGQRGYVAVRLLPGAQHYTLTFEPPGWPTGVTLFILALLGGTGYLIWKPRQRITP